MKRLVAATVLLALGGAAQDASAQLVLKGSDTLEKVTKALLGDATCNPGGAITYAGGGSGSGESAMNSGAQQIAPMSRALQTCSLSGAASDQLAIGWDAIVIAAGNGSGGPSCTGPGNDWATTLQTLYGGTNGTGSTADCSSATRQSLLDNFSSTLGGCSGAPTKIWHLFRRGDTSGTTDAFKTILQNAGKPVAAFCNGTETQDHDPIRRQCRKDEEVCGVDGTLGALLPIVVPTTEGTVSTATEDNIWYRTGGVTSSVKKCSPGVFAYGPANPLDTACCHRKFHNDKTASSPCLVPSTGGKCLVPTDGANNMCNNAMTGACALANKPATWRTGAIDGRAQNLVARADGTPNYLKDSLGSNILGAYYRLRWTGAGRTWSCNTRVTYGTACQTLDSTQQIGCLVKQTHDATTVASGTGTTDGDVGYAGDEARAVGGAYAPNVGGQPPVSGGNINLNYPLKRKLYLNSIKGFAATTGAEKTLAGCFKNASKINPILQANGFSPLLPTNTPTCENSSVAACGTNTCALP